MLIASLVEIISIGAVIPFVAVLVDPTKLLNYAFYSDIFTFLNISNPQELRFFITFSFSVIVIVSSLIRVSLLLMQSRVGYSVGADLGFNIYSSVLNRSYQEHISSNSSAIISAITKKTNSCVASTIIPLMNVVAASITFALIVIVLFLMDPTKTLLVLTLFGIFYVIIWLLIRRKILGNSHNISKKNDAIIKNVIEGLGSFRNVIIDGNANYYLELFRRADVSLRRSLASNQLNSESPKYLLEAVGMLVISWFAYLTFKAGVSIEDFLPAVGVLVLGAQRILPIMQKGYSGWTQMKGEQESLRDVVQILRECESSKHRGPGSTIPINFKNQITLDNIYFNYAGVDRHNLSQVCLTINKGDIVGITGESGSGKSTLMDILLGLLKPTDGSIYIDNEKTELTNNRQWYDLLAHVPQKIFLTDTSVAENVALGEEPTSIDRQKLITALKTANLEQLIDTKNDSFEIQLGENGANISGGQAQRIGVARAIYADKPILLLDEATSALDRDTQRTLISNVKSLAKTVIMITHDRDVLHQCDKIVHITDGTVTTPKLPK